MDEKLAFLHFPCYNDKTIRIKKRLTNSNPYDIVIGRMEELRSFFYAQK